MITNRNRLIHGANGRSLTMCALVASACQLPNAPAQAQSNVYWPNDDCPYATPIAGDGAYAFDTGSPYVTTSAPPLPATCPGCTCSTNFAGIVNDLWYLWTATCTGPVEMKTGTQSDPPAQCNLDTVLAVYNYPACPAPNALPIACCDDTCGTVGNTCDLASYVQFDAVCGRRYLVRVGSKPGTAGGYGTLKIRCLGQPCPPPAAQVCNDCCGAKPQFDDPLYTSNYTGQVAVVTGNNETQGGSPYPVVTIFNLKCSTPPPTPGTEWNPVPGQPPPATAFRYTRQNWSKNDLGSVFGVTLDNAGNIYVAHSGIFGILGGNPFSCYGSAVALGTGTSTSIFKIATGAGTPSLFVNLPGGSSAISDPGLGNITYDCAREEFFVSHFGDGRIYRISATGTILGWYHHASDTVGLGAAPDPSAPYSHFVPLGERVWAVQAHAGRLYYSVWGQNKNYFLPTGVAGTTPNRIWSIALAAGVGGNFVSGTRQQEIQTPAHPGGFYFPATLGATAPVSDISFSPGCRMLLAERDMSINDCTLGHGSRALEYQYVGASWQPTNYRNGYGYQIGGVGDPNIVEATNSAGGCDYDFASPDACAAGRVWVTGDALTYNAGNGRVYGFAGLDPSTAFGNATGLFVDYNSNYSNGSLDKTHQGDIEIPCVVAPPPPCMIITPGTILCETGRLPTGGVGLTGCYLYTFTITNQSGVTAQYVLFPSNNITPHIINLGSGGLPNGASTTVTIKICNVMPGQHFCFNVILADAQVQECCAREHCVDIPDCTCYQTPTCQATFVPNPGGTATNFNVQFTLQNLTPDVVEHMFIFPPSSPCSGTATPDYIDLPTLPPFATTGPIRVNVAMNCMPPEGSTICIRISIHNQRLQECCSKEKCFVVHYPPPPPSCPADCDFNGHVNIDDLFAIIAAWGPCPPPPTICWADINHDGFVGIDDLFAVIQSWGPCP